MDWTAEQREAFSQLLREAREQAAKRQTEVAEEAGMSSATLSSLERTASESMRWRDVVALARYYHIPLDTIATLLGSPPPEDQAAPQLVDVLLGRLYQRLTPEQQGWVKEVLLTLLRGMGNG